MSSIYDKRKLNVYRGQIGETLAGIYLKQQGFDVMSYESFFIVSKNWNSELLNPVARAHAKKFLGSKKKDFFELKEALETIYSGNTHRKRRFDFIAKKEGKYYVVEVKTNQSKLTKLQKKELEFSKNFGITPILIRTKVKIIASIKDMTIETL